MRGQAIMASSTRGQHLGRSTRRKRSGNAGVDVSVIMPTTSWQEPFETCARRVLNLIDASAIPAELIVVHDGRMTKPPGWLRRSDVRVVGTRAVGGPAAARNKAAHSARGRILFFVDADVELATDAIERVHATLSADDGPVATFGSYDDLPAAPGTVSQFRNLLHHHTHTSHPGRAGTFWAGCGAVRAAYFHDIDGFDEGFRCPSVEDIELGMRLEAGGGRIVLDPLLQGKHHKRWTLRSMVVTDITCRAVPWTNLIVKSGRLPASLNIDWKNRISGVLAVSSLVAAGCAAVGLAGLPAALACLAGIVALNLDFYLLCVRQRGLGFGLVSCLLHWLFFVYSSLAFGAVVLRSAAARLLRPFWSSSLPCPPSDNAPSTSRAAGDPAETLPGIA